MIDYKEENEIVELGLHQAPCNEIGLEMLAELEGALDKIDTEKTKALILYSQLETGFCAGADLRSLYQGQVSRDEKEYGRELRNFLDRIHTVMNRLDTLPFTTIGAIHGICFGGGFELALTCDLLVADATARFCFPELRLGTIPCFGGVPRMKREFGNALIRDFLFTGRSINARKAQNLGFVCQLVNPGETLKVARRMAEQNAKLDSEAKRQAKLFTKPLPLDELEKEKDIAMKLFQRKETENRLRKFVESKDVQPYLP